MITPEISKYFSEISKKGWAKIEPEQVKTIMKIRGSSGSKKRWSKMTPEKRSEFMRMIRLKGIENKGRDTESKKIT